eukprot:3151103-Amphidinium_carterae.1
MPHLQQGQAALPACASHWSTLPVHLWIHVDVTHISRRSHKYNFGKHAYRNYDEDQLEKKRSEIQTQTKQSCQLTQRLKN